MADDLRERIGSYRVVRPLGKGGFAEVYLAEHIYLKTQVAIKLLNAHITPHEMENFLKEARTIAHLVHPHIVRVMDFGVDNEVPFLVMDYAPNGTLRHHYPKGKVVPLVSIVQYTKQVATALQYAHEQKLIHRDVKPENILLGRNNEALLSDFGIALVAQSSRYQSTQDVTGTVAYMSPEQIQGKPRTASDQYSLGIVVYEWLSGDRPFHGSFTELCTQHMFATPPPLHEKVPTIPSEVEQAVNIALAKDPRQRFGSIQAFAHAIEQAVQIQGVSPTISRIDHPIPSPFLSEQDIKVEESSQPLLDPSHLQSEQEIRVEEASEPQFELSDSQSEQEIRVEKPSQPKLDLFDSRQEYRREVRQVWEQRNSAQNLSWEQVNYIHLLEQKLNIPPASAASIEIEIMGVPREKTLTVEHQKMRNEYRARVHRAIADRRLTQNKVDDLRAYIHMMGLTTNEAASIEIEIMGTTKEAILKNGGFVVSPTENLPDSIRMTKRWKFTWDKTIAIVLIVLLSIIANAVSSYSLIVVFLCIIFIIPCFIWFFLKSPVK